MATVASSFVAVARAVGLGQKIHPSVGKLWIILGPPGSGKGTYASILAKRSGLVHVSIGDVAREALQRPEHETYRKQMEAGQLLPDKVIFGLLSERMKSLPVGAAGMLLDGFPRTLSQARVLDEICPVSVALRVRLNDEHIITKIAGRRNCSICGRGYNLADVYDLENDVIMPPILPKVMAEHQGLAEPLSCDCGGSLERRADDSAEIHAARLRQHHAAEDAIVQFYAARGTLVDHRVRRGVGDMNALADRINVFCGEGIPRQQECVSKL